MRTLFTGQQLILRDVVDSTNNYAASLVQSDNIPEGAVIMAREQTMGRGQRGTQWQSVAGENLTFSLVYYPRFLAAQDQFMLSRICALALLETLLSMEVQASIKWPNDLLVNGKKICGVLIENGIQGDRLSSAVIGIGLNVNQLVFPGGISATSLALERKAQFDLIHVLGSFCERMEKWYLLLRQGKNELICKQYLQCLMNFREWSWFQKEENPFKAMITDVNREGKLELMLENGEIQTFGLKEIRQVI
jgi:BirA family biotin operon repressor/biotin-[acetyl-CoA-carboxylase] ligase